MPPRDTTSRSVFSNGRTRPLTAKTIAIHNSPHSTVSRIIMIPSIPCNAIPGFTKMYGSGSMTCNLKMSGNGLTALLLILAAISKHRGKSYDLNFRGEAENPILFLLMMPWPLKSLVISNGLIGKWLMSHLISNLSIFPFIRFADTNPDCIQCPPFFHFKNPVSFPLFEDHEPHCNMSFVLCSDREQFGNYHFFCGSCDGKLQKYVALNGYKTRSEANKFCADTFGTSLASIHSDRDLAEAQQACKGVTNGRGCWVGLSDELVSRDYRWDGMSAQLMR